MPYVQRDETGFIVGQFVNCQPGFAEEWLPEGTPELKPTPEETSRWLCDNIDAAADRARQSALGDPGRAQEYERAAAEAQAFKDSGYPLDAIPRTVSAGMTGGVSAQEAADAILLEAQRFEEVLYRLRELRLDAKARVRELLSQGQEAQAIELSRLQIDAIYAAVAGVGNAPVAP
ncbi:phage tail protein [Pseudomonas mosselii]|uniref:phage tail protein n=1 Tax=Pseudomonas mosselii TaxID=78327 RepID=UPI002022D825|nr:phage tail protein [Pseudomonas mosselii]MCL8302190.1 phage tail protein [Pseudomonas mosselii]